MSDPSDRFTDLLPCGCELHAGSWDLCATHRGTPHSQHTVYERDCLSCQHLLDEARELASEKPWEDA